MVKCTNKEYRHHVDTRVQVDGAFGLFTVLLIFIGVENVGTIRQLRQVEIPPLKHLGLENHMFKYMRLTFKQKTHG